MKRILLIFILAYFVFAPGIPAVAAEPVLYFDGPREVGVGSEFSLKVLVDSDQALNAYAFTINYPSEFFELIYLNDSGSILDVWRDRPQVFEKGPVTFSGGSLTPFSGSQGVLLTFNLKALKEELIEFSFGDSKVYLANGKGTEVSPVKRSFKLNVVSGQTSSFKEKVSDREPPSIQKLVLIPDPIVPQRKLASFLVKDSESGVKEAQILYRRWLWWEGPIRAQNPTALPLSAWAVKVVVQDNLGNVSESTIYDWTAFLSHTFLIFLIVLFLLGVVINRAIRRKKAIIN